ncbi:MAG: M20/M25/M40 family metallo-hydrolase [Planctomycetes bacterium]|nr:M20/M25/M40 family metallo-hydrolase [Planctomycetota bacterium]
MSETTETMRERWVERLIEIAHVDTTTGHEDRGLPWLRAYLDELGAQVHVQEVAEGRSNVLAQFCDPGHARLLFTTHLDTVPPHLPVGRQKNRVFGRGTCDAQGQIVAQLETIRTLIERGERDVAWLGVVGEETDSIGARRALELASALPSIEAIINGEPTRNQLATGQRGVMHLQLVCDGIAAHSGMPEKGRSAVHDLVDWLARLRALPPRTDEELGPEIFNVGRIEGGEALNVLARHARADLFVRTLPDTTFEERAAKLAPQHGRCVHVHATPADRFPAIPGFERRPVPFGSDAPRLRSLAKDGTIALIGPGSIDVAHTKDEFLDVEDLEHGIALLHQLSLAFLGKRTP